MKGCCTTTGRKLFLPNGRFPGSQLEKTVRKFAGLILGAGLLSGAVKLGCSQTIDLQDKETKPSVGLLNRHALVFNPLSHKLYAVDSRGGSVIIINGSDHSRSSVKVGSDPVAVAINTATNRVYVANNGSGSVSVLDGNTDTVVATLDIGKTPYVLAVNEVTNRVYVSNTFSNTVSVIDGSTNAIHTLDIGSADEIRVDPVHNAIYLLGYETEHLTILDGKNEGVRKVSAGALHLWDVALNTTLQEVYISRIGSDDVAIVSEARQTPLSIPTGKMPGALVIDLRRQLVSVANYADDSLTIVDARKHSALATLHVGEHPQAVAVDSYAGLIYVANTHGNSLSVIDEFSRKVIATLPAGKKPYALAVDTEGGMVYAANIDSISATAIDVSRLRLQALHRE